MGKVRRKTGKGGRKREERFSQARTERGRRGRENETG